MLSSTHVWQKSPVSISAMAQSPPIPPDLKALFEWTRRQVTKEDIRKNVPNNPGCVGFFNLWNGIRKSGRIPDTANGNMQEAISMAGWDDPARSRDAQSLLRYRRFTGAVGLVSMAWDLMPDYGENYLAYNLLRDLAPDQPEHLELLWRAFTVLHPLLKAQKYCVEYPFFTFGEIILAQGADDFTRSAELAERLFLEEEEVWMDKPELISGRKDGAFLFCLTTFDHFEQGWKEFAAGLQNPLEDPRLARLIHLFSGGSR
jgi:hypothetical protein